MKKNTIINILGIYLLLIIIIPKSFNNILGIIPIRLLLTSIFTGLTFIYFLKNKPSKIIGKKYFIIYLIFLLLTIPSFFVSKSIITSIYTFLKFLICGIMFINVLNLNLSKDDLKKVFKYVLVGLLITIIYGLIQYIFDVNLFKVGSYNYPGSKGRISTTFFNTIYYSIFLNMIITILFYLIHKESNNKIKIVYIIFWILSYICLLLTFTRSAILIFIVCLVMYMVLNHKIIINKINMPLIVITISLSLLIPGVTSLYQKTFIDIKDILKNNLIIKFLPNNKQENLEKNDEIVLYTDDASLNSRIEFSKIGNIIAKDHPLTGIGFGTYQNYVDSSDYTNNYPDFANYKTFPHSSVVLLYAETSYLSVIFLGILIVVLYFDLIKIWFKNWHLNNKQKEYSALLLIIISGFVGVNIIAENAIYDSQIFPIFMIIVPIILGLLNRKEKENA